MINKKLLDRITFNPEVMVGKPTIRGLRITADQILKALAANINLDDILADYPELEKEDIQAVLLYAGQNLKYFLQ
ncbi:MAG: DUF433 domain-containing protein [Actinobacteria bacterium]|nr:DUF433 domain-containing protein [Actinomycetota bacterium]